MIDRKLLALLFATFLIATGCKPEPMPSSSSTFSPISKVESYKLPTGTTDPSVIRFVSIPAGTSRLGSLSSEPGRNPSMERLITMTVDDYEISWSEITETQWYPIMEPRRTVSPSQVNLPKSKVTWFEATQFCELLTLKTGIIHRLPTEVEWEYACRAGSSEMLGVWRGNCPLAEAVTTFHRGDPGKLVRGIRASCNVDTGTILPVGRFPPNRFGLVDMHGNCWEWVSLNNTMSEPPSPLHAPIRGGSGISTSAFECRAANRAWQYMSQATASVGFRVVREQLR